MAKVLALVHVLDKYVANAARGLAANADAGPMQVSKGAVGDAHVLGRSQDCVAFRAATGLERDAVVGGCKVAAVDHDLFARVDVDAICSTVYRNILEGDVFAIGGMDRPHVVLIGKAIFHANVLAVGEFEQRGMAQLRDAVYAPDNGAVADNLASSDDADVLRIHGRDQTDESLDPAAFPAHLG